VLDNAYRSQSAALLSLGRREFLKSACGASTGAFLSSRLLRARTINPNRAKVIIVTFGGGARDSETFAIEGQRNIPHLLKELIPQGTFFTQVVNKGILGHYVATASIATGVYETFNNFVAAPPPNPTMFEYYRRGLRRSDTWVIAPSNGFQQIGASSHKHYGPPFGATVIQPKQLLTVAVGNRRAASILDYEHLLQDTYDTPVYRPGLTDLESGFNLDLLASFLKISVDDFIAQAQNVASADELSMFIVRRLMRNLAPSLLLVTLHDIDVAHSGAYSLYLEGIQRADRLCGELWNAIQNHPEYKDRTTLLILPDFGRDADGDPGGNGFQHHRTGGPLARTTWLLALGPGIRQNLTVDRPVEPIDVVPTVGALLGFETPVATGRLIAELV
jgi:hypothetical protein